MSETPRRCLTCSKTLSRKSGENTTNYRKRKFCDPDCKALFRRAIRPGWLLARSCIQCGQLKGSSGFTIGNGKVLQACRDCMNKRQRQAAATPERRASSNRRRHEKQQETARDADQSRRRWTDDEVATLLDSSLSEVERAQRLGRSFNAIQNARSAARRGELRTYDYPHGDTRYRVDGCRCEVCVAAFRIAAASRSRSNKKRAQAATVATATRRGQVWTGAEMELLATRISPDDLTLRQVAVLLGRTYAACRMRRTLILTDPKWMKAAGVNDA